MLGAVKPVEASRLMSLQLLSTCTVHTTYCTAATATLPHPVQCPRLYFRATNSHGIILPGYQLLARASEQANKLARFTSCNYCFPYN